MTCKTLKLITFIKSAIFWDVAQCRSCVNRRFGGTYRLHFQGRKIRQRETSVSRWLQTEPPVENIQRILQLLVSFIEKCAARETVKLFDTELRAAGSYNIILWQYKHIRLGRDVIFLHHPTTFLFFNDVYSAFHKFSNSIVKCFRLGLRLFLRFCIALDGDTSYRTRNSVFYK
jgi:hypothetical protein